MNQKPKNKDQITN